ncbi:hypothetical protein [Tenacibaculum sp. UWU-22]|uniref:hypothetical protein n=1 Tax=Tenacibaculum sp. UWU-22 TaxID=3234187 RepID=UPI0034DAF470
MNKLIVYILLLVTTVCFSQNALVKAEIDTTHIRIGEQFQYKISVAETNNVIIPKLENLKGFEVVSESKIDTLKNQLIKKYILTGFDSGAFYIPQQQIFIKNEAHLTDSLLINVATVAIDTTKIKKFPIKGIKGEPIQFQDYKNILFWIIAILLVVIIVLYFALKRTPEQNAKTGKSLLTPYQEALRNLHILDEKLLWQNNKVKQYYSELTEILRYYIERELHISALEQTTNNLVETLLASSDSKTIITDKDTIKQLEKLLQQADLVKFAKSKPIAHEIEGDRKTAEVILNHLKPNLVENEQNIKNIQPVIIVEKPTIKKPSIFKRIIIILLILILVGLLSFAVTKQIQMSNAIKPTKAYVK